jgi:hypothetical protein
MTRDDPLFRAAGQICGSLARHANRQFDSVGLAASRLMDVPVPVGVAWRRIEKARRRGWLLAATALRGELVAAARSLQAEVNRFIAATVNTADLAAVNGHATSYTQSPTLRSIVEELRQLREEFDTVEILPDKSLVVATTDRIDLEEVDLGPFAIELHVKRLGEQLDSGCFDCVATDPNPAATNRETTHPHVQSKSLCAGDATAAITQALRQGRINDAFCLVRSVLQTYNPQSPYVALDSWSGNPCPDCGRSVSEGDLYYCEACGNDYCDECIDRCDVCEESTCGSCLERDPVSRRDCCPSCRRVCDHCDRTVDADAFDEESSLCPQCRPDPEEEREGEEQEQPQPLNTESDDHEQSQPRPEPVPAFQPEPITATAPTESEPPAALTARRRWCSRRWRS